LKFRADETRKAKRRPPLNSRPFSLGPRLELLEDRRLLSITVDTLVDENDGVGVGGISLRDAIAAAVSGDTIEFHPSLTSGGPATILLTHGELLINKSLTINGPGANLLTIDASGNDPTPEENNGDGSRVMRIDDSSFNTTLDVMISGLTLTGADSGFVSGGGIRSMENLTLSSIVITGNAVLDYGGGIYSYGNLTVTNSSIRDNISRRSSGGGIYKLSGNLTVTGSTITGNTAVLGGGIYSVEGSGTVSTSEIVNNTASESNYGGGGGGIFNNGELTVTDSTIIDNAAVRFGGGILNYFGGTLTVRRSKISGNSAGAEGGALFTFYGAASITDSTLTYNEASVGGGVSARECSLAISQSTISSNYGGSNSGGLHLVRTESVIRHTTIAGNQGVSFGGGVSIVGGSLTMDHTISASNLTSFLYGPDIARLFDGTVTATFSLIGRNADSGLAEAPVGSPDSNGNLIGGPINGAIDPMLDPLADNGGPTMTRALCTGSPAIDAGDPVLAVPPDFDQRGEPFMRVFDGDGAGGERIDIGAFELQPLPPAFFGDYNRDDSVDAADYVVWRKFFGTTGVPAYSAADGDGDATIDQDDYGVWEQNFGETPSGGSGARFHSEQSTMR
jgi:hypothetical protein